MACPTCRDPDYYMGVLGPNCPNPVCSVAGSKRQQSTKLVGGKVPLQTLGCSKPILTTCQGLGITPTSNSLIAGGFLRRLLYPDKSKAVAYDIDVFFLTKAAMGRFTTDWQRYLKKESRWAKTYEIPEANRPVQAIVGKVHGSVQILLNSFDYTICQFATDGETLFFTNEAVADNELGILIPRNMENTGCMLDRAFKFCRDGYSIERSQIERILEYAVMNPKSICNANYTTKLVP